MKSRLLDVGVQLYSAEQVRKIEAAYAAVNTEGTYPLMEAAGKAAFKQLQKVWPKAKRILILTGKGNNGGDGFIVARLASEQGLAITLCNFCPRDAIKGDALKAFQALPLSGVEQADWQSINLNDFDLVVDAILGTGIQGAVREPFAAVIEALNQSQIPVLSIDIPSGLNADTGQVVNCAVKATQTVTYIGHKRGVYTGASANFHGHVTLANLDVPASCFSNNKSSVDAQNWSSLCHLLKPRRADSHKGSYGHCRIIGGSDGMTGAVLMAANAAARTGAGLTSAWVQSGKDAIVLACPEVMAANILQAQIQEKVHGLMSTMTLVVGPGLGQTEWADCWMSTLTSNPAFADANKVIDADGLNWLANHQTFNDRWVLTPHPGEAARLLGVSSTDINADRFAASYAIAQQYGGICILKGTGTVISDSEGRQTVCPVGNPGMASGGMGDVLSGILGGLLAQQFSLFEAAALGVSIHGEAADRAAGENAHFRGLLATDLLPQLPALLNPGAD